MGRSVIVVGVAPTPEAQAAVDWAAEEAALRGCPLHLVHATGEELGAWAELEPDDVAAVVRGLAADAGRLLAVTADRVRRRAPGVEVSVEVSGQGRVRALRDRAAGAQALVVGNHQRGGHVTAALDVLAPYLGDGIACPVVVVPRSGPGTGMVVLADGSPASEETLDYAFRQCALRGHRLSVVLCLPGRGPASSETVGGPSLLGFERRVLHDRVVRLRREHPEVPVDVVDQGVDVALGALATSRDVIVADAAHWRRVLDLLGGTTSAELAAAVIALPPSRRPAGDPGAEVPSTAPTREEPVPEPVPVRVPVRRVPGRYLRRFADDPAVD